MKNLLKNTFSFCAFIILPSILISQNTYYPPKLNVEISSNIQVGAAVEGQTKTYIEYHMENSSSNNAVNVNSFSNSFIKDVTYDRTRKTNEDYYNKRPRASTLFGGIAKAFSGDFTGLADFGGGLVDHMMTPKYRTYETSTYKTSEQYKTSNSNTNTYTTINKQSIIQKVTQDETVDVYSGFIRFSIRIHNNAQKGVRVKTPQFVLYFRFSDGSREVISFEDATAGDNEVHWLPAGSYKDFEISISDLNVKTLFSNYVNSEEIELNLNSLEIERNGNTLFAGELEEQYEDEGIRVKYFNGVQSKEFYALVGEERPTMEELARNYLNESVFEFYDGVDSNTSIAEAIRKISFNENVHSNEKVDQLSGQRLLSWRKWLVTVFDQNNVIIDFKAKDQLKPGYKVAVSYFSAKQLMGRNYAPVIYSKKDVRFSADKSFKLNIDLKKGDQIVFDNVRLEKIYTDKVNYQVQNVEIASGSPYMNSLKPAHLEAEAFLKQQIDYESVHFPDQNPSYGFNFNNPFSGNVKFYWLKPLSVTYGTKYKADDFVYLRWFKGNEQMDEILSQITEQGQQAFIKALIMHQIYNVSDPNLLFHESIPFGLVKGNVNLSLNAANNSPQAVALMNMFSSGRGKAEIEDSIQELTSVKYTLTKDLSAAQNEWKSLMQPNIYYSFLASSNTNVSRNIAYYSLGLGRHFPRMNAFLDTRNGIHNIPFMPINNAPFPGFNQPIFDHMKKISMESLVHQANSPSPLIPVIGNYAPLNKTNVEIKGNTKLFELVFDVSVIRKN